MINCTVNCTTDASASFTIHFIDLLNICVYGINVLFGFPTHTYIIWLIITGAGNGIASEFFFINLSFCEIGVCLHCLFLLFDYFPFSQYLTCLTEFSNFLQGLALTGRPVFQCLICVERYLAVIHPVTFLKFKPLRYRLMCSAVAWLINLGSCVFSMLCFTLDINVIYIYFFLLQSLLLFSIQLFCCVAVLRALKQSGPGERGREREEENNMKRRAFHLILITTVCIFFTYAVFIFSGIFILFSQDITEQLLCFSFFCLVLTGFVLPVLYLRKTGKLVCLFS